MRSSYLCCFFFFNDTATTEIYTLSLHDALPIITARRSIRSARTPATGPMVNHGTDLRARAKPTAVALPVSLLMYTASAMNVTKFPTSEIQSAYQSARSSRSLRTAKMAMVRFRTGSCMDWRLCGSDGNVPQDALGAYGGGIRIVWPGRRTFGSRRRSALARRILFQAWPCP